MEKTRLIKFHCKKCGGDFKLNVGNASKEEVEKTLNKWDSFECPGHHVELTTPLKFWEIDWSSLEESETMPQEEWLANLKSTYEIVVNTKELSELYEVQGFYMGVCLAKNKATGKEVTFDFATSPSGDRYYFA